MSKAVHTRQDSTASLLREGGAVFNRIAGDGDRAVLRDKPAHVELDQ